MLVGGELKFNVVTHSDRASWLQWRHGGIGSSDAPVIQGVSRYTKYDRLLFEKVMPVAIEDNSNSYIKNRGNKIEKLIREYYEKEIGKALPAVSCVNKLREYQIATLDGSDGIDLIIEIKLLTSRDPNKTLNAEAPGYLKWRAAMDGKVPEEYIPQIQHQLAVTGFNKCIFLGYAEIRTKKTLEITKENTAIIPVMRDEKYIHELTNNEDKFWKLVTKARERFNDRHM